jgi:hypothetical protein
MGQALRKAEGNVRRLPGSFSSTKASTVVSDELGRIVALLRAACPPDSTISFDFDGRLQVHLDIRKREEVLLIQATLPMLEAGLFEIVNLGNTPGRPFFHRITANVAR